VFYFFWCARWRGLPKESHAGMTGGCGKDFFGRSISEGTRETAKKSAKIAQKSLLVYIIHLMRQNKNANL
jgi:hypothetical protein